MSGRPLNLQHSVTQQFHPHLTQKETEAWRGREGDSQDVVGVAELWVQPRRAYAPVGIPSACGCLPAITLWANVTFSKCRQTLTPILKDNEANKKKALTELKQNRLFYSPYF